MTWDNFKSFKSIGFELVDADNLLTSERARDDFVGDSVAVKFIVDLDCDFRMDEAEEVFLS